MATMEATLKAELGVELYTACVSGDLDGVTASAKQALESSQTPPWSTIMYAAASADRASIIEYCLDNGGKATNEVIKITMIAKAKNVYTLLLERKAVDVDYYIGWFGDVLGNRATEDDFEWTKLCLSYGANPNANLVDEHKILLAAVAELASIEMAALLIEYGAQVRGSGAIVMAAEEGKMEMVQFLLEKGADIDEIGIEHPTDERFREDMGSALHRAVLAGHEDVVLFLLDRKANVELRDVMGRTPLMLARAKSNKRMEDILRLHGASE